MNQSKAAIQAMLDAEKERFIGLYGGEIVRHASPECPNKIKLGVFHKVPNLVEDEWQTYLRQVEEGTYQPDTHYQAAQRRRPNQSQREVPRESVRWRDS